MIERGKKRILWLDDDELAKELSAELSTIRNERERVSHELADFEQADHIDIEAEVDSAVDRLWTLGEELSGSKPTRLRELLYRMVNRIDLTFSKVKKKTRAECPFSKGVIALRPDQNLFRHVNRGDWI